MSDLMTKTGALLPEPECRYGEDRFTKKKGRIAYFIRCKIDHRVCEDRCEKFKEDK